MDNFAGSNSDDSGLGYEKHNPAILEQRTERIDWYAGKYPRIVEEKEIEGGTITTLDNGSSIIEYYNGVRVETDERGTVTWYLNDLLHRVDGPAVKGFDGSKEWYRHGKKHRIDGPAEIDENGDKWWWFDDEVHREDGPAIEHADTKKWYFHGRKDRVDGPAVTYIKDDGTVIEKWYRDNKKHREDGPAVVTTDKYGNIIDEKWYIDGKKITDYTSITSFKGLGVKGDN